MPIKLQIITGLSGSGKTIALHTLEDLGYYCIDNLPITLMEAFAHQLVEEPEELFAQTAVGIDVRSQMGRISSLPPLVNSRGAPPAGTPDRLCRPGDRHQPHQSTRTA